MQTDWSTSWASIKWRLTCTFWILRFRCLLVKLLYLLQFLHWYLLTEQLKPDPCLVSLHLEDVKPCYWLGIIAQHELEGAWKGFWFVVTYCVTVSDSVSSYSLLLVFCKVDCLMPQLIQLCLLLAFRHIPNMFCSCLTTFPLFCYLPNIVSCLVNPIKRYLWIECLWFLEGNCIQQLLQNSILPFINSWTFLAE